MPLSLEGGERGEMTQTIAKIPCKEYLSKLTVKWLKEMVKKVDPSVKTSHLGLTDNVVRFLMEHLHILQNLNMI